MSILIRKMLQWLGSKIATLFVIIGILLAANWVRTEWAEISKLMSTTSALDAQIAENESAIEKLRGAAQMQGSAAIEALKAIQRLDEIANQARKDADTALSSAEYWSSQVGWWQVAFEDWKVRNKAEAWGVYYTLEAKAKTAKAAAEAAKKAQENAPWAINQLRIDSEQKELEVLKKEREFAHKKAAETPSRRLILAVLDVLPDALGILAALIVFSILIKAVLFFIVAPLADKVAPIKIEPGDGKQESPRLLTSGVSLDVEVGENDELLAHPDYLQSSAKSAHKLTKWFLNHRLPFSSLLSGMCVLTRVRAKEGERETIKISPTRDPLGELALIELPAGAAMVLYPRSLAAVVKTRGQEISIQSRWRLKSLHGWLTLQFRYLVFHGPCKVVVKGCRGVCVEKPVPGKPRLISQSATIGFSGNLEYSNTRSEVFMSYLRGKDDLFNDLFGGENGVFVYEEMPDSKRKAGLTGRGLEGITDAFLKAFGV